MKLHLPTKSDPFMHPCKNIVKEAQKLLDDEKDNGNNPSGINIEGIGQFSEAGLSVLKQFCTIGSTRSTRAAQPVQRVGHLPHQLWTAQNGSRQTLIV